MHRNAETLPGECCLYTSLKNLASTSVACADEQWAMLSEPNASARIYHGPSPAFEQDIHHDPKQKPQKVCVLGGGNFGTAMAFLAASKSRTA